jgi:hypothetical protein
MNGAIVHKTHYNPPEPDGVGVGGQESFSDFQLDAIAQAIAESRVELRTEIQGTINGAVAPLRERVAMLEGQVSALMMLLGSDSRPSIEASETSTTRKLRMSQ